MFERAILYVIFNMETLNINEMSKANNRKKKEAHRCHCVMKNLFYLAKVINIAPVLP